MKNTVRGEHVRGMLARLKTQKEEKEKDVQYHVVLQKRLTYIITFLLSSQGIINILQSSTLIPRTGDTIQILAVIATLITVVTTAIGKHMLDSKRSLANCMTQLQKWEKEEDTFKVELAITMEDGQLTAVEHQRLLKRFSDARAGINHQNSRESKTISHYEVDGATDSVDGATDSVDTYLKKSPTIK